MTANMTTPPELWDTADIAAYLRQSRKSVQNRLIHRPDFPDPIRGPERPKMWVRSEILDYLFNRGGARSPTPRRGSSRQAGPGSCAPSSLPDHKSTASSKGV